MAAGAGVGGSSPLRVERRGDLLFATLDDPARANALSPALAAGLTALYRRDLRAEGVRAVLLAGAGRHFCAGADLSASQRCRKPRPRRTGATPSGCATCSKRFSVRRRSPWRWSMGRASPAAAGLATACDFVVAADDARFLYSEVRIGFVAALVATYLPLRVRGSDLRELLLAPEFVPAARALEIGLVNRVVPRAELDGEGERWAGEILARASSESIARTKRLLLEVLGRPLRGAARPRHRGERRGARDGGLPARHRDLPRDQGAAAVAGVTGTRR